MLQKIVSLMRKFMPRKPDTRYVLIALSGEALMVWTPGGNIVLSSQTARSLARRLEDITDLAEEASYGNHASL